MLVTSIFSYSQSVFCSFKEKSPFQQSLSPANGFNLVTSEILSFGKGLDPFFRTLIPMKSACLTLSQRSPYFYVSAVQVLKTLWEKEKLLMTSNFSFSHSVSTFLRVFFSIFIKYKIFASKLYQF